MTAIHHFWLGVSPFLAVVTSATYPVFVEDALSPGLALTGGALTEMPRPTDGMSARVTLSGGTLLTSLTGAQGMGAVGSTLSVVGGTLVSGRAGANAGVDALAAGLSLTRGTLVLGLISHAYAPEAIASGLSLTSGTLV